MKKQQFIDTARKIATDIPTRYELGGWGQQKDGKYLFDCVCLIKSILWGFNFEKGGHGGAVFCSNGVPDVGANDMFNKYCYDKSTDFTKITEGELVWMDGHIGIYVGDLRVVEATAAWDNKVLISSIDYEGRRTYNYTQVYKWTHHGKCQFIDYSNPTYKYSKGTNVVLNGWLHKTKEKDSECLGEFHDYLWTITDTQDGEYPYQLNKIGWCRETYLTPYQDKNEYEQLYKKEMLISKDLEKQVEQSKNEVKKLNDDLKIANNKINKIKEIIK